VHFNLNFFFRLQVSYSKLMGYNLVVSENLFMHSSASCNSNQEMTNNPISGHVLANDYDVHEPAIITS